MINSTYSNNEINPRIQPLLGYDKPQEDAFALTNKSIQSWSFDGSIPLEAKMVLLWNKDLSQFNIKAGDYVYILNDLTGNYETKPVISVTTDPDLSYSNGVRENGSVPVSFISDVFIEYLDENGLPQIYTVHTSLDEDGYPLNTISKVSESWELRSLGTSGWNLSSSGNAIFNNVAVRGSIDATSGNFSGNLTVNNGEMKIGSSVSPSKYNNIIGIEIVSNKLKIFLDGTNKFEIGDPIKIIGSNSFLLTVPVVPEGETQVSGSPLDINGSHIVSELDPGSSISIIVDLIREDLSYIEVIGRVESTDYNSGIFINDYNYWYDDGHFEIGNINAGVSWNPDISTLNITGDVTASKIRGSDVYGDSFQIGGNEFGWVAASGDIFSGTDSSTFYIKSGFYSNPITYFEQELSANGTVKRNNANISGSISAGPRSLYADLYDLSENFGIYDNDEVPNLIGYIIKPGYQIKVNNEYLTFEEVVNYNKDLGTAFIRLRSLPKSFYKDYSFSTYYTNTTLISQFEIFTELPEILSLYYLTFEGPGDSDFHATNIPVTVSIDGKTLTTQSMPPVQNVEGKPKTYIKNSLYATLSNVSSYNKHSDINRIIASLSNIPGSYYNTKIFVNNAFDYIQGDLFYINNIPTYYSNLYSLNNSYFPVIDIDTDPIYGDYLLIYADGYLSFTGDPINTAFTSFNTESIEVKDNVVTITINKNINDAQNPKYDIGQLVKVILNNAKLIDNTINLYNNISTENKYNHTATITNITEDELKYKISYIQNITDIINTSVSGTISSFPTIDTKNLDNTYSITIGDSKPDNAPFQIDQFGENVKIKNLEVTGNVTGFYYDIIELDDFSAAFDGRNNTFLPRYNQEKLVLDNPLRLMISLNGVVQSAFIKHKEYVWQTGFLGYKGYTLDDDGKIKFSESPPPGSTINARVLPGPTKNKKSRIYPFKAVDVALG